jgi:hypothetical protein
MPYPSLPLAAVRGRFAALRRRARAVADDVAWDVDRLARALARAPDPVSLGDVLPRDRSDPNFAPDALLAALCFADASGRRRAVRGDLAVGPNKRRVIAGDLRVRGTLQNGGLLVVLGDVHVEGFSEPAQGYGKTVITGSLRADRYVVTEHMLAVGGALRAPFVFLDFNQGFAKVLAGAEARLLVESDHGGSRILGPCRFGALSRDELVVDDDGADAVPVRDRLADVIAPAYLKRALAAADDGSLGSFVWEQMKAGRAVLR